MSLTTRTEDDVRAAAARLRAAADTAIERIRDSGRPNADDEITAVRDYVVAVPEEWHAVAVATARVHDVISSLRYPSPPRNLAAVLGDPPPAGLPEPWSLTYVRPRPSAEELSRLDVLVVLDIDGVVLRQPPRAGVKHRQLEDDAGRVYDLDIVERVVELSDILYQDGVEFCWSSSWGARPRELDQLLQRLPDDSLNGGFILAGQPAAGGLARWKLDAVRKVEAGLPKHVGVVWIDDQLHPLTALDPAWAADSSRDRLLIAPHASSGLLPGHLRQIEAFIDGRRARA
ncbi:HAD domain-containing protein [Leifsonia sp. L25]|uniref:HAD domain-containing protein n=1 Tax=Actinomycetes TaxID=1760 RepID=UPI003D68AE87